MYKSFNLPLHRVSIKEKKLVKGDKARKESQVVCLSSKKKLGEFTGDGHGKGNSVIEDKAGAVKICKSGSLKLTSQ